jgi:hypothetical protein
MKIKEINNILDQEIKFSRETPLADTLDENFVDGFIKGLAQARYLLNAAARVGLEGSLEKDPDYFMIKEYIDEKSDALKSVTTTTPCTSGYVWLVPEPIPNLNKILEKYDGIIITGPRGSGKTTTALKVIDYIIGGGKSQRNIFIFPTRLDAYSTLESAEHTGLLNAKVHRSNRCVRWPNESIAHLVSSENHLDMHGLQSGVLWLEEVGSFIKNQRPDVNLYEKSSDIFDFAEMSHRLDYTKVIITGTDYKEKIKDTWLEKLNLYTYNLNMPI